MTALIRYPAGPITPHGAHFLHTGRYPTMVLHAHDGSIRFDLMGGMAIPDPTRPECVQIKLGGIKGLVPPWRTIDQKGATQDGVTFVDALYDPMEVTLKVTCRGRDPEHLRRVVSDLLAAIDIKRPAELAWLTPKLGRWWTNLRWFKTPPDSFAVGEATTQELTLILRADNGFWRSHDHVDSFGFSFAEDADDFGYTQAHGLGSGWDIAYSGEGGGELHAENHQAAWRDDPQNPILSSGRDAVARRVDYTSNTDNQVVEMTIGGIPEWSFPDKAYNDIWGRMPDTGTPGDTGVRVRLGWSSIRLSFFVNGHEIALQQRPLLIPPLWGETFSLVCGYQDEPRMFKVLRGGTEIMSVKEVGANSKLGAGYRSAGFGVHAGGALLGQSTPAAVSAWSVGDNGSISQTGTLKFINVGDQPMHFTYTLFGPGMFYLPYGAGSTDYVRFGPLLANQVFWIDTDPDKFRIKDLTSTPPTPAEQNLFADALNDFIEFATGNNAPPLLQEIESWFGVKPPQGNPYSLLLGRWGTDSAIPAKSPGKPAKIHKLKVSIEDGNADSKVIVAGTPRRRYPL